MQDTLSIVSRQTPVNAAAVAEVARVLHPRRNRRVTVLMGGISSEREVSLNSGTAAVKALEEAGYLVHSIEVTHNPVTLCQRLEQTAPDVVFNALHGRYGEDGCLQGLLNFLQIPYTHSGLLASALAMDKPTAKKLFSQEGIPVADGVLIHRDDLKKGDPLPRPYVIKPYNEGSSVGITIIREKETINPADIPWPYSPLVMVERFIPGRELTVGVMEEHALGVTEMETARTFYDYEAKYTPGASTHTLPAAVPPDIFAEAQRLAIKAHRVLGCRGVSRADFRYDGHQLVLLEINTQPGMTATSLVPEQAALAGISFPDLCAWMVETAQCDL